METIIYLLAIAVLSIEITYHSTLADDIKKVLYLDILSQPLILKLSKQDFWLQLSSYNPFLYPLVLLVSLYFKGHYFILKMINCPYCLGFHLSWVFIYFNLNQNLLLSLAIGLTNLITISILNRLMNE